VLTRSALEMLKSIATGNYKSPEERAAEKAAEAVEAVAQAESALSEEQVVEAEPAAPAVLSESKDESESGEAS